MKGDNKNLPMFLSNFISW